MPIVVRKTWAFTNFYTEILIQKVKRQSPEQIAQRIESFDQELCNQVFLSELKSVLPTPEQIGKLNVYKNASAEELGELHMSDRLMVKLIQIDRLAPRIEGMLYKCKFDETFTLLEEVRIFVAYCAPLLMLACRALRSFLRLDIRSLMQLDSRSSSV